MSSSSHGGRVVLDGTVREMRARGGRRQGDVPWRRAYRRSPASSSVESRGDRHVVYVDDADAFVADLVRSDVLFRDLEVAPVKPRGCVRDAHRRERQNEARSGSRSSGDAAARAVSRPTGLPTLAFSGAALLLFGRHFERGEPERLLAGFAATALLTVDLLPVRGRDRREPHDALGGLPANPARVRRPRGWRVVCSLRSLSPQRRQASSPSSRSPSTARLESPVRFVALFLVLLVGSVPFAFLGIAFGYWLSPKAALPVANLAVPPTRDRRASCGPGRRTRSPEPSTSGPSSSRREAGSRSSTRSRRVTARCRPPRRRACGLGRRLLRARLVGLSPGRRASGSAERLPDRAQEPGDLVGARRARVRLRSGPRRRSPPRPPRARSSGTPKSRNRPKPPRAASSSTRAGASSVPSASPNRAIASGTTSALKRSAAGRQMRVHRALRQPVPAPEHLRHRVREAEPDVREGECRAERALEQARAPVDPPRLRDDERQRVVDRGRARVGVPLGSARAGRVVVRLGAVREGVHRRADGRVERKVEGQLGVVDRRDRRRRARPSRPPSCPARAASRRTASTRRRRTSSGRRRSSAAPLAVLGERGDDGLAGVDRAAAAQANEAVRVDGPGERARLAHGLDGNVRPARRRSCRRPETVAGARGTRASGDEQGTSDPGLGADVVERLDRAGAETDDPSGRLGGHSRLGGARPPPRSQSGARPLAGERRERVGDARLRPPRADARSRSRGARPSPRRAPPRACRPRARPRRPCAR